MDAIDQYIQALSDPVVRSYWRRVNQIDEEGPGPDDGSKVSEQELAAAEQELGFALPPSYRKLVTTTEPYDGVPVGWIIDPDKIRNDIVTTYLNSYHPLPPFLMAVIEEPNGDAYCFDMRHPDERGEYPIVHFDHEVHNEESTDFETVARDLGEFLLGSLGGETPS